MHIKLHSALFGLIAFFTQNLACADLSVQEQQLIEQIDQSLPEARALLQQVVNINSGTLNLAGVKAVGKVFQQAYDELGFDTQWLDGSAFGRAGHLVARYGQRGPKLLLIGHLDTVFASSDPFQHYRELDNNTVAGPGITDMKGGNVIMLYALQGLKQAGMLDNLQVRVVLTGDEEASGRPLQKSKAAIIEGAKWADIALGFEDADGNIKTAVVARRGSVNWTLDVVGRPAHSSQIFSEDVGYGAVFEMARILNGFREALDTSDTLTLNPGISVGGTSLAYDEKSASANVAGKSNVIAAKAYVQGGIRALTPGELDAAVEKMRRIAQQSLAHTEATFTLGEGYPPMSPTEGNDQLLGLYSDVSRDLGYGSVEAVNPRNAGAADISFAAGHVKMALDGLGLMGSGGHTADEKADMTSLAKNTHKAAILMHRLSRQEGLVSGR